MREDLLQYLWKFQYIKATGLATTAGESIQILFPGNHNTNQGPDFNNAKIKIRDTVWAGNIELHINSSHWNLHSHSQDANFNNIILHVVWNHDVEIKDIHGNNLPTLELKTKVSKILLDKYRALMNASYFIPCENMLRQVNELTVINWKQRLSVERLLIKSGKIITILEKTNFHWEEAFWWLIAANFGLKVNSDFFQRVAMALPVAVLAKHKNNIHQIESLLFGTAGMLDSEFKDKYPLMLQKEFVFYQNKYKIKPIEGKLSYLRMRPANFPTIRLAQLAILIHESEHLFSKIKEANSVNEVKKMLDVTANDYWHYHYVFDEESGYKKKKLGQQMINNIIINTIIPVLFAYGLQHDEQAYKDKALRWLEDISPEKNGITKGFEALGLSNKSAFDSQALLQLKNEYCNTKRCLVCAIGNSLLKREA